MSHRAAVAERQGNGRFNIHHSRNGADQIQLLDELRASLTVHGDIDWESLTGRTQPAPLRQMSPPAASRDDVTTYDTGDIVNPRPFAVNVPREEILLAAHDLMYEVLYVIDDGTVEAYWLTWTYPDVIRPWADHLEVEVYEREPMTDPIEVNKRIENEEPLRTIADFEPGWLEDEVTREVVRTSHRWLYEMQSVKVEEPDVADEDGAEPVRTLGGPEYQLRFRTDTHDPLVPQSHPFILPIRLGPSPCEDSLHISQTAQQTRFAIGAGLQAAERVSDADVRHARIDALTAILEQHHDRVEPALIPGELGDIIATSQQTSESEMSPDERV